MDLNIIKPHICSLERLSSVLSKLSQNLFADPSRLGGGVKFCKFTEFPLWFWILQGIVKTEVLVLLFAYSFGPK